MDLHRSSLVLSALLYLASSAAYSFSGMLTAYGMGSSLRTQSAAAPPAGGDPAPDSGVRAIGRPTESHSTFLENELNHAAQPYVDTGGARINIEGLPAGAGSVSGAAGHASYVQVADGALAIYDKLLGRRQFGPDAVASMFGATGRSAAIDACRWHGAPGAVIMHDQFTGRWIVSYRVALRDHLERPSYYQCIAVSAGADAAGAYFRYALEMKNARGGPQYFDDPKLAIWPGALYLSFNLFEGSAGRYLGPRVCGVDRQALSRGVNAAIRCRDAGKDIGSLTPATWSGAPHANSVPPLPLLSLGASGNNLQLLRFSFSSARFGQVVTLPVAPFATAGSATLIAQSPPGTGLAPMADRIAPQAMYRPGAAASALFANHSVRLPDGRIGIRWYQIDEPLGAARVVQQGTLAAGTDSRWMGAIGVDKAGNIAIGYNAASSDTAPGWRYTGRSASDRSSTMQSEEVIVSGSGVDTQGEIIARACGSLSLDPADECTFWASQRYVAVTGAATWRTRIASFRFRSCP